MSMLMLYGGRFGEAVADEVQKQRPVTVEPLTQSAAQLRSLIAQHDFIAVATWRPYVELCRTIDTMCHELQRPWSIVEVVGSTLVCGPSIRPGTTAGCYHCFVARVDAHKRDGDRTRALRNAYAHNAGLGPAGFTHAMTCIAAATLLQDAAGDSTAGEFRRIDLLSGAVLESRVIPIHACPRCRPAPVDHDPTRRFVNLMVPELEKLAL